MSERGKTLATGDTSLLQADVGPTVSRVSHAHAGSSRTFKVAVDSLSTDDLVSNLERHAVSSPNLPRRAMHLRAANEHFRG